MPCGHCIAKADPGTSIRPAHEQNGCGAATRTEVGRNLSPLTGPEALSVKGLALSGGHGGGEPGPSKSHPRGPHQGERPMDVPRRMGCERHPRKRMHWFAIHLRVNESVTRRM